MTTTAHRPARTVRFVAALVLALQLAGTATATPAHAINPPQRTVKGTVDALYPWINYFSYHVVSSSGRGYRSPGVGYADGPATHFTNGCSYDSKMLDANDVWEGYWTLGDAPYPAEGTGPTGNGYPSKALRQGWFLWGFNSYSVTGCATHAAGV